MAKEKKVNIRRNTFAAVALCNLFIGCANDGTPFIVIDKEIRIGVSKMERYPYDLSSYAAVCGGIGRLQTINVIPVCAGDSLDMDLVGSMRLSSLKRALSLDAKVDIFSFFVPHRHVYDNWEVFIQDGINGTEVLSTVLAPSGTDYVPVRPNHIAPLFYPSGYAKIWNEYFRIPNVSVDESTWMAEDDFMQVESDDIKYGKLCSRLPTVLTTGVLSDTDSLLGNVPDDGSGGINLVDINQIQAGYKSQIDRDWFQHRYRDVMKGTFGANSINTDADERPTLIMHTSDWMSGYDVDGTGVDSLGQFSGKSQMMISHQWPSRYFKEHGSIFIMILVRFPTIFSGETSYFINDNVLQNYKLYSGDPLIVNSERPHVVLGTDYLPLATDDPIGIAPFGQFYRTQPNRVHFAYDALEGYPFIDWDDLGVLDVNKMAYEDGNTDMFNGEDLKHWNLVAKLSCDSKRIIPPASHSLNVGAKLR